MSLTAHSAFNTQAGYHRIFATPPGGSRREITIFRGAPIIPKSSSSGDPFSDQTAALELPQVTPWDKPGSGDLDWLVDDADIDIVWQNTGQYEYDWRWEGSIVSMDFGVEGTTVSFSISLKGALFLLDNYQAKPSFPKQPIPYELLIQRAFDQSRHPCRLSPLKVSFPEGWSIRVPEDGNPDYLNFLRPWGVTTGEQWTGFVSRSTGTWEPMLTGHVQSLLSVMYAEGGDQWSIRNLGRRRPELYLRQKPDEDDPSIIEVTVGEPGMSITGSKDFTQRANVIYGSGSDDAGIAYNGMQVTPDGSATYFKPFAYSRVAYPRRGNPQFNPHVTPKEVMIQFQDGVSEDAAYKIAQAKLHRFSDPGLTGSITLQSDVRTADGQPLPRFLIKAGRTLRIKNLLGVHEGVLAHITSVQVDYQSLTVSLTYDTKYRDELTVEEVQARTRDALTPLRSLQVGKYSNTVQDLVLPWSYREGSGVAPMGATEFFNEKIPSTATFPYEEWTTQFPPSNPAYRPYYIRIGPTDVENSNNNWSGVQRNDTTLFAIPIRMAQAGTIKLSQMAAYDKNGNVVPVRFHLSVYKGNGVAADAMPKLPAEPGQSPGQVATVKYLEPDVAVNYKIGQSHPFYEGAWESVDEDGTPFDSDLNLPAQGSQLIVGWGNYYEPAGYWPGRFSRGAEKTGLLNDSTAWTWDLSDLLDLYSPENNATDEYSGMLFIQIYCDDQLTEPVFFMGRFLRQEPGTQ